MLSCIGIQPNKSKSVGLVLSLFILFHPRLRSFNSSDETSTKNSSRFKFRIHLKSVILTTLFTLGKIETYLRHFDSECIMWEFKKDIILFFFFEWLEIRKKDKDKDGMGSRCIRYYIFKQRIFFFLSKGKHCYNRIRVGTEGFEPPSNGTKTRCLTAWPRPISISIRHK